LASKDASGVRLVSRNGRDLTRRVPELAAAVAGLKPSTLVLDGEVAVFDRQLV
jgi:ATP-dependent DNA ligase